MEITKLSTKGQIVIPENIRMNMEIGTPFTVMKKDDLIILKRVKGLTKYEEKELSELNKVWKEIDRGDCKSYTENEFFNMMQKW